MILSHLEGLVTPEHVITASYLEPVVGGGVLGRSVLRVYFELASSSMGLSTSKRSVGLIGTRRKAVARGCGVAHAKLGA